MYEQASSMSSLTADLIHPTSTAVDNGRDNTSSSNSNTNVRFPKRHQPQQQQQQQSPIQPPTTPLTASSSFTTQHSNSSSTTTTTPIHEYSLFDQHPAAWEWFGNNDNNNVWRKHSVAADGADFGPCQQQRRGSVAYQSGATTAADWRRGSAAAAAAAAASASSGLCCALCSSPQAGSQLCGHTICQVCLSSLGTSSCPLCCTQTAAVWEQLSAQYDAIQQSTTIPAHHQHPFPASMMQQQQQQQLLTPPPYYPCVKLANIPWDVSQNDVRQFFSHCRLPNISVHAQAIHIMMDRTTGKTLSDAYVEFATYADLRRAMETRDRKPLKGRIVTVNECTQEELLKVVFPKWRGQFCGMSAIPPASDVVKNMSTAAGGGGSGCPPFVTREEINSLLVVCKNYKLHFSRKCAERPFENIISVIAKYPWHQAHLISAIHRDHIYEMLKLSIESLKVHLSKDYVQIDGTLLERLVRVGIMCPAFTERQKTTLLQTARIGCPPDLMHYLLPLPPPMPSTAGLYTTPRVMPSSLPFISQPPPKQQYKLDQLQSQQRIKQQYQQGANDLATCFPDPTKDVLEQLNALSIHGNGSGNDYFFGNSKSPSSASSSSLSLRDPVLTV